jgi:hypothetical protein
MNLNLDNIEGSKRLELKPGINIVTLNKVTYHEEFKTKKGMLPCLELEFKSVKTASNVEERFTVDKIFPIFQYRKLDTNVSKGVTSFTIIAQKLKHIFSCYGTLPPYEITEGETAYADLFKYFVEFINSVENYQDIKLNLIACYNGKYLGIPRNLIKNFCEVYTANKETTLTLDPNIFPLTPEVETRNSNAAGGIASGMFDEIPV